LATGRASGKYHGLGMPYLNIQLSPIPTPSPITDPNLTYGYGSHWLWQANFIQNDCLQNVDP